jgi:hypothetical protein
MKMDLEYLRNSGAMILAQFLWLYVYLHSHGQTKESLEYFNKDKR